MADSSVYAIVTKCGAVEGHTFVSLFTVRKCTSGAKYHIMTDGCHDSAVSALLIVSGLCYIAIVKSGLLRGHYKNATTNMCIFCGINDIWIFNLYVRAWYSLIMYCCIMPHLFVQFRQRNDSFFVFRYWNVDFVETPCTTISPEANIIGEI